MGKARNTYRYEDGKAVLVRPWPSFWRVLLTAGCLFPILPFAAEGEFPALLPAASFMDPRAVEASVRTWVQLWTEGDGRPGMLKALERSGRWREQILRGLLREGLPLDLVYLPLVESEFRPDAVSPAGAAGLWQLMPATARRWGLRVEAGADERLDPAKATPAALKELKRLRAAFGDWDLALAAYNLGEFGLRAELAASGSPGYDALRRRGRLPDETGEYVPRFRAAALIARDPGRFGLSPRYEPAERR